jgi:hypothetical protein
MNNILVNLSKLVKPGVKIEPYLSADSTIGIIPQTIVWTGGIDQISPETYEKFRLSVKPKICRFYAHTSTLPYHDLCIALLYSAGYTLNHNNLISVQDKTCMSAWRSIGIMAENAHDDVKEWLKKNIKGRDLHGYSVTLNVNRQNVTITRQRFTNSINKTLKELDDDKLYRGCDKEGIVIITEDTVVNEEDKNARINNTPEGELMKLLIEHTKFVK